ncbi:unnamed protein product [Heligmosomoides polygyrus]|uniref:C2 domain-containing protein n=1 Tax=Heligmosomoides polygyrus TaxID=6339 RepID=A0A183GEZ0_HELPZ|nr:unnamed protein product [Heligmosomoides polygyrus]
MKEKSPEFAGIAQGFQKGSRSRLVGELKLLAVDSGAVIATLKYELNTTEQLGKAITNFQAAEAAQKVLPIEIPNESGAFEVLTVMVHRCTGLDKLRRGELEVCVIYEFFSFSPYFTSYVTSSKTAEFNSKRDWSLPSDALQSYLTETEITFFLFENRAESSEEKDGVLAMLSLPLVPLTQNKPIKGSFEMVKQETYGVNGINGATARDETTLIRGKLDDFPDTSIDNSPKDSHGMRNNNLIEKLCQPVSRAPALRHRSTGRSSAPVALPDFIFLKAASVSLTVIF